MENSEKTFQKTSINWYPGHMAKTKRLIKEKLSLIDVVYEVIDARMPYSSKIKDIDMTINDKPRILIMTKYDLCDKIVTDKWLKYYENKGYKVLPVNLEKAFDSKQLIITTEELMKVVNEKRKSKGMLQRRVRILIVGIPNVGKSTLINRLVGKKAVAVGNKPGVTKQLSWIRINEKIELLDSPGILWPKLAEEKVAYNLASLTAIKEEILPIYEVANYILKTLLKYYPVQLQERYGQFSLENFEEVYNIIGRKRGCLVKGGEVDYDKVVNVIINDVKNGSFKNITFDRFDD